MFFLVSGLSCPPEVYLSFSFASFSAAYFYPPLFFPPLLCLYSFLSVSGLSPHFLICLSGSCLLANDKCSILSFSVLLSLPSGVSLYCGVSHDLSLRDPMLLDISLETASAPLLEIHATFPHFSLLHSVSLPLLAFPLP